MNRVLLRRVDTKNDEYRKLKSQIVSQFEKSGKLDVDKEAIIKFCEPVKYNGDELAVEIDDELLDYIVFSDDDKYTNKKYQREADLAAYFSKAFREIPQNLMYDAAIWTYLNTCIFLKYVETMYLDGNYENPVDRVERYLFNIASHSKIDRTGMRFLWLFGSKLCLDENQERATVAMEFIDPVKAIFERKMSCNNAITMAFVDAIIKGGKNPMLKNKEMRKAVPHHIQCYAGVTNLDAFKYEELVDIMVEEQNRILGKM